MHKIIVNRLLGFAEDFHDKDKLIELINSGKTFTAYNTLNQGMEECIIRKIKQLHLL